MAVPTATGGGGGVWRAFFVVGARVLAEKAFWSFWGICVGRTGSVGLFAFCVVFVVFCGCGPPGTFGQPGNANLLVLNAQDRRRGLAFAAGGLAAVWIAFARQNNAARTFLKGGPSPRKNSKNDFCATNNQRAFFLHRSCKRGQPAVLVQRGRRK